MLTALAFLIMILAFFGMIVLEVVTTITTGFLAILGSVVETIIGRRS